MALYREQHCTVLCGRSVLDVSLWWSCWWGDASTPSTLHGSQVLWTHRGGRAASQLASLDTDQRRLYQLPPTSYRLRRRPIRGSHVDDLLSYCRLSRFIIPQHNHKPTIRVFLLDFSRSAALIFFFTCASYAEDIGWTSVRLSVSLSVCPSQSGTVSKLLNILPCFLHHTIAHSVKFCVHQDIREIPTGSPPAGPLNRGGVWKCRNFRPITRYISKNGWR